MAGTYGEPGKNPFQVKGIGGILSPVVNAETGVTQIYKQGAALQFQSLGTYNPSTGKFTADPNAGNLTQSEIKALSSTEGINNIKNAAKIATAQGIKASGGTDAEAQAKSNKLISPNSANPTGNPPEGPSVNQKTLEEESASSKDKTRKDYQSIKYPENLNSSFQDCIKFSIIKYQPPGLSGFGESLAGSRFVEVDKGTPKFLDRKKNGNILATITLPIPGGIQDSNTVNWSRGEIDPISGELGNIIQTALSGGNVEETVGQTATGVQAEIAGFKKAIISKAIESGVGANNIMQRQFGTIINPNVELLFNAPELRTFSFSFKLSPRSAKEAQIVKTIIRNFKQAMSVKRSSSSFLLQTPHTFAISYIFKNESHPYLNRFKECALISCNVNYTPEGNYMAFDDSEHPSMVSYQLDLTFQELEPLYDDEYGDEKEIQNIGF